MDFTSNKKEEKENVWKYRKRVGESLLFIESLIK